MRGENSDQQAPREFQFDGLVGPTHNYGGLSPGNTASTRHAGLISNPREAFLQGLRKMRFISSLGVGQGVLPPHERPHLKTLKELGFSGSDGEILEKAYRENNHLLRLVSSSSAMWTANAATVVPASDAQNKRTHFIPANLKEMFHRTIEAEQTTRSLRAIFCDPQLFSVHDPLPGAGQFADEGAANHTRLETSRGTAHLFAWGRSRWQKVSKIPQKFPARQTLEASQALARLAKLPKNLIYFPQQSARGIDGGAFHTDVLCVGHRHFVMAHEAAFEGQKNLFRELKKKLGAELFVVEAREKDLALAQAVRAYPFNSQVLSLPSGEMTIIAPSDAQENKASERFLRRVVDLGGPVTSVHFLDVRQSMQNGGGPACLRLRVLLSADEIRGVVPGVFYSENLFRRLERVAQKFYRDRLHPRDLRDLKLYRESCQALDEITQILGIGSIYDFQK